MSLPGWTTPPMVLTFNTLMMPCTGETTVVRVTRSSMAMLEAVIFDRSVRFSFSSLAASERKVCSDSSILLLISLIADSARGIARVVAFNEPRISTALRLSRRISTGDTAPVPTSGVDMFISCCSNARLELNCPCFERNSANSWVFCRSCSLRVRCSLARRRCRCSYSERSSSATCGALAITSSDSLNGRPSASAESRSTCAVKA
ncbi:hypothetical protein D3C87_1224910 [compost metagenome]